MTDLGIVVVFIMGTMLGIVLPGAIYGFLPVRSRKRTLARLIDDAFRLAVHFEALETVHGRFKHLAPVLFRSSAISGLDVLMLTTGLIRGIATDGGEHEIDTVRLAYVREQVEAALLDGRGDE